MPDNSDRSVHAIIAALVPTPGSPIANVRLLGYLGTSSKESHLRLYENLSDLTKWVDILRSAVLCVRTASDSAAPHDATHVWIRADSLVELPSPEPITAIAFAEAKTIRPDVNNSHIEEIYGSLLRKANGDTETDGGTSTGGTAGGTGG